MIGKHNQQPLSDLSRSLNKVTTLIANISHKHITSIGRGLGRLIYFLDVRHRRIVRRNLTFVYPEWTHYRVKRISKRVFENLGMTVLEILQMTCLSKDNIMEKVKINGQEHVLNAMQSDNGVIFISAHLGNWEMVPLFWPLHFKVPITVVAKQLNNHFINRWTHILRTRFGSKVIYKAGAMPEMTRALRQGKMLALLIDQGGSPVDSITFFGKLVTATPAAALLALRCNSPVLLGYCVRNSDGTFTIKIEPPLALKRTDDLRSDLRINTQMMMDVIEKAVRENPEQWFWVHKRWKDNYPHLYYEDMDKKRQQEKKRRRAMRKRN